MRLGKSSLRLWQLGVIVLAFIAHVSLFVTFHGRWDAGVGYFVLLPLITVSVIFGLKGGVFLGILAHPVNLLLWYLAGETIDQRFFQLNKVIAWVLALVIGVFIGYLSDLSRSYRVAVQELEEANEKLTQTLAHMKTLKGLLPICSGCKKIRDDEGYWQQVEVYIRAHSEVQFSHGLCPECAERLYPQVFAKKE